MFSILAYFTCGFSIPEGAAYEFSTGLEDGFEKNLGFLGFLKNLKGPKISFFLFFGEILYRSYYI